MRGSIAHSLLPALAVLALCAVVAIAATGSTPAGSGESRPPAEVLLDTVFTLGLVLLAAGGVLLVYGLMQRKAIAREVASGRYRRTSYASYVAFMLAFGVLAYLKLRNWERAPIEEEGGDVGFPGVRPPELLPDGSETTYEPELAILPTLAVLALAAVGVAAAILATRRRRPAADDRPVGAALAEILSDTLDDLHAEADPRRAVIAAYARFELILAAHGLPRHASETSAEYLTRILLDLEVEERSVRRLTDLFTMAKFSHHEVDFGMKRDAIEALRKVRDELQSPGGEEQVIATPPLAEGRA
ncbi:MAG TPA: DUF4129 domain-containing protein [Gaiellaceae bacterium]|nr:DUF4129 domain-containing protein [Gaiellaceae bacterium]